MNRTKSTAYLTLKKEDALEKKLVSNHQRDKKITRSIGSVRDPKQARFLHLPAARRKIFTSLN